MTLKRTTADDPIESAFRRRQREIKRRKKAALQEKEATRTQEAVKIGEEPRPAISETDVRRQKQAERVMAFRKKQKKERKEEESSSLLSTAETLNLPPPKIPKTLTPEFVAPITELGKPKSTGFFQRVSDTLKEGATLGKVETETFNRKDLETKSYQRAKTEMEEIYVVAAEEAAKIGEVPSQSLDNWVKESLGTPKEYANRILAAAPGLLPIAKEVGLNSIPLYGTARGWSNSPGWVNALSVGADILTVVPFVGQVSALSRAGVSLPRAVGRLAIAEAKAPITVVTRPRATVKAALEPIETVVNPRKLPLASTEVSFHTVRVPEEVFGLKVKPKTAEDFEEFQEKFDAALQARDQLTDKAIRGRERPIVELKDGTKIELSRTGIQKTTEPIAIHSTPDIRPLLDGFTVKEGREGGLFFAPNLHSRFTITSAFGDVPEKWARGAAVIRDPEILSQMKRSDSIFAGTLEIEAILPQGIKVPKPSQILFTRSAGAEFERTFAEPSLIKKVHDTVRRSFPGTKKSNSLKEAGLSEDGVAGAINLSLLSKNKPKPKGIEIAGKDTLDEINIFIKEAPKLGIEGLDADIATFKAQLKANKEKVKSGSKITLAIYGKPFTRREIAKMKFVGGWDAVRSIFDPPFKVTGKAAKDTKAGKVAYQEMLDATESMETLLARAEKARGAGKLNEAVRLEGLASQARKRADNAAARVSSNFAVRASTGAAGIYTGRQDLKKPLNALADRTLVRQELGDARRTRLGVPAIGDDVPPFGTFPPDLEGTPFPPPSRGVSPTRLPPPPRPPSGRPPGLPPREPPPGRPPRTPPPDEPGRTPPPPLKELTSPFPFTTLSFKSLGLKEGEFPRVIEFPLGIVIVKKDLVTGKRTFRRNPFPRQEPGEGFKVLQVSRTRPLSQVDPQGIVDIKVTTSSIQFVASKRGRKGTKMGRRSRKGLR